MERILWELDLPVAKALPERKALHDEFVRGMDPLLRLMFEMSAESVGGPETPNQRFAVTQLIARALNDLAVAFHLAMHGYLNQTYNSMRAAYEGCHLIDLLAGDAGQAELWADEERWWEFTPGRVRKKLGQPRADEFYARMSGMSHPSMEAARLTGHMAVRDGEVIAVKVQVGPYAPNELPILGHAVGLLSTVAMMVAWRLSRLTIWGLIPLSDFKSAVHESLMALHGLGSRSADFIASRGQPEVRQETDAQDEQFAFVLRKLAEL